MGIANKNYEPHEMNIEYLFVKLEFGEIHKESYRFSYTMKSTIRSSDLSRISLFFITNTDVNALSTLSCVAVVADYSFCILTLLLTGHSIPDASGLLYKDSLLLTAVDRATSSDKVEERIVCDLSWTAASSFAVESLESLRCAC